MVILYGTIFLGKIAKYRKQGIETKFFYVFLPIFPISSIYVTSSSFRKRQGIDIPLNMKSVLAGYARVYLLLLSIPFMIAFYDSPRIDSTIFLLLFLFLAGWVYFMFFYGAPTLKEIDLKNKLLKSTGSPLDPKFIEFNVAIEFYESFERQYKTLYGTNWKDDIKANYNLVNERPLIYGLSLYCYYAYELLDDSEIFEQVDKHVTEKFFNN